MHSEKINGWIFIDKPIGLSSNKTLGIIKKTFMNCKAGFVGTLDPLASGFLPIALGKSTKTIKFLSNYLSDTEAVSRLLKALVTRLKSNPIALRACQR